jgi:hypothetical protein
MTPRHTVDACRDQPSTPRLALPRCGSFHPLSSSPSVLVGQPPLGRSQRRVGRQLLSEADGRLSPMATQLIGHPPRKRDIEALDDRHNIIRHADRLVWHVRSIRTCRPSCRETQMSVRRRRVLHLSRVGPCVSEDPPAQTHTSHWRLAQLRSESRRNRPGGCQLQPDLRDRQRHGAYVSGVSCNDASTSRTASRNPGMSS